MKKFVLVALLMVRVSYAVNVCDVDIGILEGKRLCFFPGSFDPVHRGHEDMIRICLDEEGFDYVLVSVAGEADVHKPDRTSPFHRRQMVDCLFENHPRVLTFLGTTRDLQILLAPYCLHFVGLLGSDTLNSCFIRENRDRLFMRGVLIPEDNPDHGFASGRFISVQEFIVNMRQSDQVEVGELYDGRKIIRVIKIDEKFNSISSTLIRDNCKNKDFLNDFLSKEVVEYISEHQLYEYTQTHSKFGNLPRRPPKF